MRGCLFIMSYCYTIHHLASFLFCVRGDDGLELVGVIGALLLSKERPTKMKVENIQAL